MNAVRLKLMPEDAVVALRAASEAEAASAAQWRLRLPEDGSSLIMEVLRSEPAVFAGLDPSDALAQLDEGNARAARWVLPVYDGDPLDVDCDKADERYYEWRLAWGPELYHCDEIHVALGLREASKRDAAAIRRTHRGVHRALAGDTTWCRWCEVTR